MREGLKRLCLILASIVATLVMLEVGLRASTWDYLFVWPNFVLDARTVLARQDSGRYVHDDRVGYVLRADTAGTAVQSAREAARRAQCVNNLKQLGLALHNYSGAIDCLPMSMNLDSPGFGYPEPVSYSGLSMLLPYMEQSQVYNSINYNLLRGDPGNNTAMATSVSGTPTDSTTWPRLETPSQATATGRPR